MHIPIKKPGYDLFVYIFLIFIPFGKLRTSSSGRYRESVREGSESAEESGKVTVKKGMGLIVLAVCAGISSALADSGEIDTARWIELGLGSASTLEYKQLQDNRGWAVAVTHFEEWKLFGDSYSDRTTGENIDVRTMEVSVMRVFAKRSRWGYADASIGLAYIGVTDAVNCSPPAMPSGSSFINIVSHEVCDKKETQGVAVPIELDWVFGRYLGAGIKLRASVGESYSAGLALNIPLGGFARK